MSAHLPESFSSAGVTDRKNNVAKEEMKEKEEEEEGEKDVRGRVKKTEEDEGAGESVAALREGTSASV